MRDALVSVAPVRDRFRFFVIEVRETAERVELVRRWGRVGTEGRCEVFRFATLGWGSRCSRRAARAAVQTPLVMADREVFEEARREVGADRAARGRDSRQLALL
ncbi:WGR domain-containing protein [Sandaracinus amylolyticus]|uniref:WGR domain-containing protein n=1 Tax=Sandaracinus amylolyticus TaxID=927083 RepID=A0A0F6YLT0_9BACT|nr:hypothetical protein DB32_007006 [Sandaracinus amylolyticus]